MSSEAQHTGVNHQWGSSVCCFPNGQCVCGEPVRPATQSEPVGMNELIGMYREWSDAECKNAVPAVPDAAATKDFVLSEISATALTAGIYSPHWNALEKQLAGALLKIIKHSKRSLEIINAE